MRKIASKDSALPEEIIGFVVQVDEASEEAQAGDGQLDVEVEIAIEQRDHGQVEGLVDLEAVFEAHFVASQHQGKGRVGDGGEFGDGHQSRQLVLDVADGLEQLVGVQVFVEIGPGLDLVFEAAVDLHFGEEIVGVLARELQAIAAQKGAGRQAAVDLQDVGSVLELRDEVVAAFAQAAVDGVQTLELRAGVFGVGQSLLEGVE